MDYICIPAADNSISCLPNTHAVVDIFWCIEYVLIKHSHFAKQRCFHQPTSGKKIGYILQTIKNGSVWLLKFCAPCLKSFNRNGLSYFYSKTRQISSRELFDSCSISHSWSDNPYRLIIFQYIEHCEECCLINNRIGIKNADVRRLPNLSKSDVS